jgi:transposase
VQVKSLEAHERRALLAARHRLVTMRVDLDGQIRGILKTFGLIAGPGNSDAFLRRAEALAEGHAVLAPLVTCLAQVRRHVASQISALDREIGRIVRADPTLRRFVSVPCVGPITALAFLTTIDISPGRSTGRGGSPSAVTSSPAHASTRLPTCCSPKSSVGRR